jgi:hypothetical protein
MFSQTGPWTPLPSDYFSLVRPVSQAGESNEDGFDTFLRNVGLLRATRRYIPRVPKVVAGPRLPLAGGCEVMAPHTKTEGVAVCCLVGAVPSYRGGNFEPRSSVELSVLHSSSHSCSGA